MKFNEEQYQKALPLIKTQLKALIARDLWDMNEYFRVMNTTNESVQKALEILRSGEYQKKLNKHRKIKRINRTRSDTLVVV